MDDFLLGVLSLHPHTKMQAGISVSSVVVLRVLSVGKNCHFIGSQKSDIAFFKHAFHRHLVTLMLVILSSEK